MKWGYFMNGQIISQIIFATIENLMKYDDWLKKYHPELVDKLDKGDIIRGRASGPHPSSGKHYFEPSCHIVFCVFCLKIIIRKTKKNRIFTFFHVNMRF